MNSLVDQSMDVSKRHDNSSILKKECDICWIDEVNLFSLWTLYWCCKKYPLRQINYFGITKFGQALIKMPLFKGVSFKLFNTNLSTLKFEDNTDVYHLLHQGPPVVVEKILKDGLIRRGVLLLLSLRYQSRIDKIELLFKQKIAQEIRSFIKVNNIIRWNYLYQDHKQARGIFISKDNAWSAFLKEEVKPYVFGLFFYPNVKDFLSFIFTFLRWPLVIVLNGICCFVTLILGKHKKSVNDSKGKVAVLHAQGADLDRKADYYWFPESGLRPEDVLVYFRVPYRPLNSEARGLLNKYGMSFIDLTPKRLKKFFGVGSPEIYIYPTKKYVVNLLRTFLELIRLNVAMLFQKDIKIRFWELKTLVNLFYHSTLYETAFAEHKVKVHFSLMEGEQLAATNLAADMVGAVNVANHWSNYPAVWLDHGKDQDVYFSWGPFFKHFFDKDYYLMNYLIYFGYPHDRTFKICKEKAQLIRRNLEEKGVSFVISFFDEAYHKDDCFRREDFESIYKALIDELNADPTLGVVVKPKRKEYYKSGLPHILKQIEAAQQTGRFIFMDETELPNTAAQVSDIALGLGVFNTATLEAALAKIPAVTLNGGDLNYHPFYKNGLGKITFDDVTTIMQEIRNFRKGKASVGFANYAPFLSDIDPFIDGKAGERMGKYIKWIFDEMNQGVNKKEAIEKANRCYIAEYGSDKISKHCAHNYRNMN